MAISEKDLSNQRKSALTAGISLIIMTLASFFSYGFVHGTLVVQGDASATFINIVSSNNLFKGEILGWIIIMIADILVAWAFYVFLEPVNQNLSLLGAWLRLTYSAILAISILTLIFVLLLTGNTNGFSTLTIEQTQAFMMLFLDAFQFIWSMGLVVFGGHLLIVGYVALKSDVIPKVISILLLLASIGYIIIHLSKMFLPQYEAVITTLNFIFTIPMIVGELGFGIWLLLRGGKIPKSV
ncbi:MULTISPECIES: DUF4386 domain-containing protein [Paenibacillus]|uniref:DUF4386 domain-containing protein n=1 Tax=Paenibacillus TaxID=44249 RepID=UPI0003E275C2|nr:MULTISPECIES: DUF4386 domain-containing protein [Paenibacillus]AIQ77125.1 hypothetical protein PODO_30030 [Paenibacillus odorifer]ETT59638.1 hypothetical protein C171_15494 [Paenibacillus sp. FSL H8-237]MEC0131720.1 DUF4386 domain-containing protein [Paenibacillus odorifer]MEC0220021.1 DUF4386 domain-containing protein [Paenibacillus odorifer]OME61615.1 hypothetical protein BSK61_00630 [Paenibacillus odorifer]